MPYIGNTTYGQYHIWAIPRMGNDIRGQCHMRENTTEGQCNTWAITYTGNSMYGQYHVWEIPCMGNNTYGQYGHGRTRVRWKIRVFESSIFTAGESPCDITGTRWQSMPMTDSISKSPERPFTFERRCSCCCCCPGRQSRVESTRSLRWWFWRRWRLSRLERRERSESD